MAKYIMGADSGECIPEYFMYINGDWVKSFSGETFEDYSPIDGSVFAIVQKGGKEDAEKAVDAAYEVRDEWGEMLAVARAEYLHLNP